MVETLRTSLLSLTVIACAAAAWAQTPVPAVDPTLLQQKGRAIVKLHEEWTAAMYRFDAGVLGPNCNGCSEPLGAELDAKAGEAFDYLTRTVREHGWVSAERWGKDVEAAGLEILAIRVTETKSPGSSEAIAFAKSVLPDVLKAVETRGASANGYSFILDQVELFEGRPQVYGTQFECVGGRFAPYSVLEPEKLNQRRASIGLPPIEQHRYFQNAFLQEHCASQAVGRPG